MCFIRYIKFVRNLIKMRNMRNFVLKVGIKNPKIKTKLTNVHWLSEFD